MKIKYHLPLVAAVHVHVVIEMIELVFAGTCTCLSTNASHRPTAAVS